MEKKTVKKEKTPVKAEPKKKAELQKKESPLKSSSIDETRSYLYETKTRQLARDILADGYVTPREKLAMESNHNEIIRDFLVATDLLSEMENNPGQYLPAELEAARFVVARLIRAREISWAKIQQIKFANFVLPNEKAVREERRRRKEYLDINFNLYQIFGLDGSAHEVVEYAREQEKNRVMTSKEVKQTKEKIMDLVDRIVEKGKSVQCVRQFLEDNMKHVH
ncbi:MAG: hypothetical protein J6Y03_03270 [Alphaproteobacteria bacterium]|nr:hypothetical protein [Alphaproteobacteria bacterium]